MFSTQMGSVSDDAGTIYLRPETAQGIFVNFLNVQKTGRMKVPLVLLRLVKLSETRLLQDSLYSE
jgi:glycyl-tRNA synthetase